MSAMDFFKMIYKSEDLPNAVMTEIIMKLFNNNEENMAVKAVEEIDLPSQAVAYIARENPDLSYEASQRIVDQIKDEDLQDEEAKRIKLDQEKSTLSELQEIEDECTNLEMNELITRLKEVEMPFVTDRIQDKINHIVAKETAFNCMKFGGPRLEGMFQFFSAEDMLENNFVQMVKKEYDTMKKDCEEKCISFENLGYSIANGRSVKYKEYKQEDLKRLILEKIAKNVAKNIDEVGEIIIPQLEKLSTLSAEEKQVFIDSINNFCQEELDENDIVKIERQMQGEHKAEMEDLINMLEKLPRQKKDLYVESFVEQINTGRIKNRQENELSNAVAKFLTQIDGMPTADATKVVNSMTDILKERKQARQLINSKKVSNSTHEEQEEEK